MTRLALPEVDRVVSAGKLEEKLQELVDTHPFEFPLDSFCEQGGWPPEDDIDVTVRSIERDSDHYTINIAVGFDEIVPTSCGDIQMTNSVHGEIALTIDRETGEIDFNRGSDVW